jgi:hypothetical protein
LGKGAAVLFALHPSYIYSAGVMENTLWATAAAIGGSILLLRRATYRMIEVFFVGLIGDTLFTEKPMTGILFTGIASYRMIPQIRAWPLFLGSWMLIPLLWSIRGWIVFGEFAPTKNYAGFIGLCESWHIRSASLHGIPFR